MRVSTRPASLALLLAAACGGGSTTQPPSPPASVDARPGDGQALVAWSPSPGATGYVVYHGDSPQVTKAAARVTVTGTSTPVTGLANRTARWFAVAAVNAGGEGGLSPVGCVVPTPADQSGLLLLDALCSGALEGRRWRPDGALAVSVSGGAAVLRAEMNGMEAAATHGAVYGTSLAVNPGGQRVTTLRATIVVPRASASRAGDKAQVRASVRLRYSKPATRLLYPRALQDMLALEVGLVDQGSGLKAFRVAYHCDDASCATSPGTGTAFTDPAGWGTEAGLLVSPAAYDTAYVVEVRLAEGEGASGVFHWSIAGGAFGAGAAGAADPAGYLAGPAWSGVPIGGAGSTAFEAAQLRAVALDRSSAGGGSGRIGARFDDVQVGFDDGPAAAWDDFGGTGGNSGPEEVSYGKWVNGGAGGVEATPGALVLHQRATSAGDLAQTTRSATLNFPEAVNTLQADVRVASALADFPSAAGAVVQGRFYNDGRAGAAPGSALGDVFASVSLPGGPGEPSYTVATCDDPTCTFGAIIEGGTFAGAAVGDAWHTVRISWDPQAQRFSLTFDGTAVTVDPAAASPVAGPASAPMRRIAVTASARPPAGTPARIEVRVNNVFVAP